MKKLMILILLSAFALPFYAVAKDTNASYPIKMLPDTYYAHQFNDFSIAKAESKLIYDYLGYLPYGGVIYSCYGTYPYIYHIEANIGTVYSFTPCQVGINGVYTNIESSNGNFLYNDWIWNE